MNKKSFASLPIISTNRLRLRAISFEDEKEILKLRSDERVNKYLDRVSSATIEEARQFIGKILMAVDTKEAYYWAITRKDNDKLIGTICYFNISDDGEEAEIGFELLPEFQGQE